MHSGLRSLAASAALLLATACVVEERRPAPPPHAPAHGRRAQEGHIWLFYPDVAVYFCSHHRHYWHRPPDGVWVSVDVLPATIALAASVEIDLIDEEPWRAHAVHLEKYPPGQWKKETGGPPPGKGPKDDKPGKGKGRK